MLEEKMMEKYVKKVLLNSILLNDSTKSFVLNNIEEVTSIYQVATINTLNDKDKRCI